MVAYYNEIDPYAAQTLRNLIAAGHIAPGVVDERDIRDVCPNDLRDFTQCHFFAGVGVWSYALRLAQWPDARAVWTGSCPCQPFSVAGGGAGFGDERHLWPYFHALIEECQPAVVLGEQVASKDADPWIDLVQDDMEALGYAVGAVPFPSAGVGAPHIRDRLYWVANTDKQQWDWRRNVGQGRRVESAVVRTVGGLADLRGERRERRQGIPTGCIDDGKNAGRIEGNNGLVGFSEIGDGPRSAGPTNGQWADTDWLFCRDGKWRPVEPGTFPLAHGAPARVGRLRAYGNAINAIQAQIFIETVMECQP